MKRFITLMISCFMLVILTACEEYDQYAYVPLESELLSKPYIPYEEYLAEKIAEEGYGSGLTDDYFDTESTEDISALPEVTHPSGSKPLTPEIESRLTYIDGILIANKTYSLPADYDPGINSEAKKALEKMFKAAEAEGVTLKLQSGYRSYEFQKELYEEYTEKSGQAEADRYSARPGHSEHQTGLGFDLNEISKSFEETPEYGWLQENACKYGFILRYPKGKESVTGYMYEPWHYRYLGVEKAKEVYESGLCLEEYLGITSAYKN